MLIIFLYTKVCDILDFEKRKFEVMDSLRDADLLESFDILEDDHQALLLRTYQKIDETQAHCIISIIMSSDSAYSLIYYVFAKLADFSKQSTIIEFLNKLNIGGDKDMMAVFETIQQDNKRIYRRGKKEGIMEKSIEIAKKLLKENFSKEKVARLTGLTEAEIENIK